MSWSKVQQPWQKPLKFWYHKILCELGWYLGGSTHFLYHRHLKKILRMGFNLYGEKKGCKPVRQIVHMPQRVDETYTPVINGEFVETQIDLPELLTPDQEVKYEMLIDRAWRELTAKLP